MDWLGHARVSFTSAPDSLEVKSRDGSSTTLQQICEDSTPPCWLNPLLFNGHLQTMYTALKEEGPKVFYKRKIFDQEDPIYEGTFAVDFVTKPFPEVDTTLPVRTKYFESQEFAEIGSLDSRPMLIALHGLSGGSYEIYLHPAQRRTNLQNLQTRPPCNPTVRCKMIIRKLVESRYYLILADALLALWTTAVEAERTDTTCGQDAMDAVHLYVFTFLRCIEMRRRPDRA